MANNSVTESSIDTKDLSEHKMKFLSEFIDIYHSLPALWQIKSKIYRNKKLKNQGYELLINKLKEISPTADRDTAIKKINSIRSNFRKETKKVRAAAESGMVYVPSLWYYNKLTFLYNQEVKKERSDDEEELSFHSVMLPSKRPLSASPPKEGNTSPPRASSSASNSSSEFGPPSKRMLRQSFSSQDITDIRVDDTDQLADMSLQHDQYEMLSQQHQEVDNEYDILGKRLAFQLRGLEEYQKICAEKIIADVIFYAKLGKLTEFSTLQIASLPRQIRTVPLNSNLLARQNGNKESSSN